MMKLKYKLKNLIFYVPLTLSIFFAFAILINAYAARDLTGPADTAVSTAKNIGRIISVLGVVVGGVFYNIPGLNQFGRTTMIGGLLGAGLSFGGPSLVELFRNIFGA